MRGRIPLLLGATLLSLLAAELFVRFRYGTRLPEPRRVVLGDAERSWCCVGETRRTVGLLTYQPGITFRHCYDGEGAGELEADGCITYRTNSWGYRDVEHELRKPPGSYRIVILGDSFSVGEGTRFESTWPRRLAASLASRTIDGRRPEVVNLSMPGADTASELLTYRRNGSRLDPDLVILQWSTTDFLVSRMLLEHRTTIGAYYRETFEDSPRYRHSALVHAIWYLARRSQISRGLVRLTNDELAAGAANFQQIRSFRDAVVADGSDFLLVVFPELIRLRDHPYASLIDALEAFAEREEIGTVNLLPELASHRARELWVHETDHHPNQLAHEIAQRSLLARLPLD